jgi:hypothetical protein
MIISNRDSLSVMAKDLGDGKYRVRSFLFGYEIYDRTVTSRTAKDALKTSADAVSAAYKAHLTGELTESTENGTEMEIDIERLDTDEWGVEKILDIRVQGEDVPEEGDTTNEAGQSFPLTTDLSVRDVSRGDVLWITALLKPKHGSTAYAPGQMGVLKVRVMDVFKGLSALKNAK